MFGYACNSNTKCVCVWGGCPRSSSATYQFEASLSYKRPYIQKAETRTKQACYGCRSHAGIKLGGKAGLDLLQSHRLAAVLSMEGVEVWGYR